MSFREQTFISLVLVGIWAGSVRAETFTVCNTLDLEDDVPVEGSFRWALQMSNETDGGTEGNRIVFDLPCGPSSHLIQPRATSAQAKIDCATAGTGTRIQLLIVARKVAIDGLTQNAKCGQPLDRPMIELDGELAADQHGLRAQCVNGLKLGNQDPARGAVGFPDGSVIRGLVLNRWGRNPLLIDGTNDVHVVGNIIGLGWDGATLVKRPNIRNGMVIEYLGARPALGTIIGGPDPLDRNIISANGNLGIDLDPGAENAVIQGNWIGTDADGNATDGFGNGSAGVYMSSPGHHVGGLEPGEGNLVVGSGQVGIRALASGVDPRGRGTDVTIEGNTVSGSLAFGISLDTFADRAVIRGNSVIGGTGGAHHNDYGGILVGTELVHRARDAARDAGCEVLHVDYTVELGPFYASCGFVPTPAGLIHLGG